MTRLERRVLQQRSLTRLAQIKQMGLAFLDFPGLTRSRLAHSIGVMHVADRLFETLRQSDRRPRVKGSVLSRPSDAEQVRQAVRLAALFHDLGHPPFSHAVESTFTRYPSLLERAVKGAATEEERKLFEDYSHEEFTQHDQSASQGSEQWRNAYGSI